MQQPNIDLKTTTSVEGPNGEKVFQDGYVLRKISKFIIGTNEDSYIPIPCFYEASSGKILIDSLPPQIREEYRDIAI